MTQRKVVVTGGAGFIGSQLVDNLIAGGNRVVVIDNFSTGRHEFLPDTGAEIIQADLRDSSPELSNAFRGADSVFHLAANADVRFGWNHPRRDLEQNVIATLNVLETAVEQGVDEFIFSSTGSVYGEAVVFPTPEVAQFPIQTSLYGASKSAAESFIEAYATAGKIKATIFRFVSVLGPRYTHGHVIDFVRQLMVNPEQLHILGDGGQRKSYMHVRDCIRAIVNLRSEKVLDVFNLGAPDSCTVLNSANWICNRLGLKPEITYEGGERGWVGDSPFILLDVTKAQAHGWQTTLSIQDSVIDTVGWLLENPWALKVEG